MPVDERFLKAILRFALDKQGLNQVEQGAEDVEEALDKVERKLGQVREAADALGTIGETMAIAGAAMVAPFALAANSYIQYAGRADIVSRQWLNNQRRLEQAQLRVGRVAAQAILPVMERLADLAEDAADFAEKHPGAIKAALGIGGTLAVVGGAATTIARAVQMVATVKGGIIALARLAGTGAGAAGAAGAGGAAAAGGAGAAGGAAAAGGAGLAAGGVAASVLGGVLAGGAGYQAIAKSEWGQRMGLANLQQYAATAAYGLGKLTGGTERANQWFVKVSGSLGAMDDATQRATEAALGMGRAADGAGAAGAGRIISQEAVDTFIAYRKAVDQSERQYEKSRSQMVTDFAKQRERATVDFEKSQAQAAATFQRQRSQTLEQFHRTAMEEERRYYEERRRAVEQFGIETRRAEEDHQRNIARMREDYDMRQMDAIASGDARRYLEEQRRYEMERRRTEQDYQVEASRRGEDQARQLAEMEEDYQVQREQRLQQLQQTLAEQSEAYAEQQAMAQEQHAQMLADLDEAQREQLATLDEAHQEELATLEEALAEQLAALDQNLLGEQSLRNTYYEQMTADLEKWLDSNATAWREGLFGMEAGGGGAAASWRGIVGGRQAGGYTDDGLYRLHRGEFVLNPQTTRMAERLAGGRLTQQSAIGGVNLSVPIDMSGWTLGEGLDPATFRGIAREQAYAAVNDGFAQLEQQLGLVMGG